MGGGGDESIVAGGGRILIEVDGAECGGDVATLDSGSDGGMMLFPVT